MLWRLFLILLAAMLANAYAPAVLDALASLAPAALLGLAVGLLVGVLAYGAGWDARGRHDAHQAKEGIDKKEAAGRFWV